MKTTSSLTSEKLCRMAVAPSCGRCSLNRMAVACPSPGARRLSRRGCWRGRGRGDGVTLLDRSRFPSHASPAPAAPRPVIFSGLERATRSARLMFRDRAMVFDQAPMVLPAAECAAHWYLASSEHGEIARLSAELGFQVAARSRARELYAGLYAHRDTPPLACRSVRSAGWGIQSDLISEGIPH
jgi:hypothetical protein